MRDGESINYGFHLLTFGGLFEFRGLSKLAYRATLHDQWTQESILNLVVMVRPMARALNYWCLEETANNVRITTFVTTYIYDKSWVVKLWTYHFYSPSHNLLCKQVVTKVMVKVVALIFSKKDKQVIDYWFEMAPWSSWPTYVHLSSQKLKYLVVSCFICC